MEWIFILGMSIVGALIPEYLGSVAQRRVLLIENISMSIGFALVASYFAFK